MSAKNEKAKEKTQPEKGKKGKKGKGKKKLEIKLSKVEESFYQLTVADCEKKIHNLRQHLQFIAENNDAITERMRSIREDHKDGAAERTTKVNTANEKIYELYERLNELSREYYEMKKTGDATITDLEDRIKAMYDQLSSEIKTLKAHLNLVQEYPKIEERLNYINELEEVRRAEKEQEAKELLDGTERRIKGERETMRKEVEREMLHVSEEFTRSSTLRNAAYTQRLIRENIALEKEINILDSTLRSTDQQLKEQVASHKEVKATFPALNEKKKELIMIAQQKTKLIEQLTSKYEKIKAAYVESLLYKTQYEDLVKYQLCGHFQRKEMMNKAKKIGRNAHSLKTDCMHMEADFEKNKQEIEDLKGVIGLIRETVLKTIGVLSEGPLRRKKTKRVSSQRTTGEQHETEEEVATEEFSDTTFIEHSSVSSTYSANEVAMGDEGAAVGIEGIMEHDALKSRTQSLLVTLFNILSFYQLHKISIDSLQTVSCDRLLMQHSELCEGSTDSLREAYKFSAADIDVAVKVSDHLTPAPTVKQTIPTERPERCPLFEVEKGSTLYVSLSDSNPEKISVEAQPVDDQEEIAKSSSSYEASSSSSEDLANATDTQATEKESKSQLLLSQMPAGTILDIEMADEGEEEDHEFDQDIYLADRDQEHDQYIVGNIEEDGEEEMPIYMFY